MSRLPIGVLGLVAALAVVAGCSGSEASPEVTREVVVDGLLNPLGIVAVPSGGLLVAEQGTGEGDDSAGVSFVTEGVATRVVSGLPSSRDSGDLSGAPLVGISPDGGTAYTAHFGSGQLLTFPVPTTESASVGSPLAPDDLEPTMTPLNRVQLVNPFDIAFTDDAIPVVTDASGNGVARETADGTTEFIHRFGELSAPEAATLKIDPVPTGIARVGDEYYVSLTGGCPFPQGAGRVVAIDDSRTERLVIDGLNMPIDVAAGPDGNVWVLEFARFDPDASCFSGEGYLPGTGRLSRLIDGQLMTVAEDLDFPGAILPMADGSVYITEVFGGRVVRLSFDDTSGTRAPEQPGAWRFTDVAAEAGLDFRHGAFHTVVATDPVAAMGAGLCWLDFDGDGRLDLYLVNSYAPAEAAYWVEQGGPPHNALYRNVGNRFRDVSERTGTDLVMRGNGCLAADFDADGDTDLYVTADGPNALLINDRGYFTNVATEAGVAAEEWSTAAAAGDLDSDGLLDIYVGSYIDLDRKIADPSGAFPQDFLGVADHLYLNQGDGTFLDAAAATGLDRRDRTLGTVLSDLDGDGDLDLYVANDGQPNRLFLQESSDPAAGVRFIDVTAAAAVGDSGSGMGIAAGDYDSDGTLDLFVTNWEAEPNALYRGLLGDTGDLGFLYNTYRTGLAGLGVGRTGWGTAWADFDHDRDLDLFVANGKVPVTNLDDDRQLPELYGNMTAEGRTGQFRNWTESVGMEEVGPRLGRGSAVADYDNDGDLDIAVATIGGSVALLRNDLPPGNWLQVELRPFLPGALVTVVLEDGDHLIREARAGGSYLATEDPRLHFGLGSSDRVQQIVVAWPGGATSTVDGTRAGRLVVIEPPD